MRDEVGTPATPRLKLSPNILTRSAQGGNAAGCRACPGGASGEDGSAGSPKSGVQPKAKPQGVEAQTPTTPRFWGSRGFLPSDYMTVARWYALRDLPPWPLGCISPVSRIALDDTGKPAALVVAYLEAFAPVGMIAHAVCDPGRSARERHDALKTALLAAKAELLNGGAVMILADFSEPGITRMLCKHGFAPSGDTVQELFFIVKED